MNLFIELKDGQPINHPIAEWNLRIFYPDFDPENLPPYFAKFKRIDLPVIGPYEVYENTSYELVDGIYQDIHNIRQMTPDEKEECKIKYLIDNPQPYPSWSFDETNLRWEPPIPIPDQTTHYYWDEKLLKWMEGLVPPVIIEPQIPPPPQPSEPSPPGEVAQPQEVVMKERMQHPDQIPDTVTESGNVTSTVVGIIADLNDLPTSYTGTAGDTYFVENVSALYSWTGTEWLKLIDVIKMPLKDLIVIKATIDDQQVKILGVLSSKDELSNISSHDVLDSYIIDDINEIWGWDGNAWVKAIIADPQLNSSPGMIPAINLPSSN